MFEPEDIKEIEVSEVYHLPIIKAFADRIDLVNTVNRLVPSNMEIDPGTLVLAMVLDTLSGRHPLYRIENFYAKKDIELLLGRALDAKALNDDNFGRLLDLLYAANTAHVFSGIAMNALRAFTVPTDHIHFDTTSVTVYGAYEPTDPQRPATLKITKGYSKDHRPDLNQFLISLLCTGGNVPIFSNLEDGNASDKKINNTVLTSISGKLSKLGIDPAASIYIADSAFVTEDNLRLAGDTTLFLSRLPATFAQHDRLIEQAVQAKSWQDYGMLSITKPTRNRPGTQYRGFETTVDLYGRTYRAVVVHSSAHDQRRQKRLQRHLESEHREWTRRIKDIEKINFFCRADAEAAGIKLSKESLQYHQLEFTVVENPRYARGRPKADGTRALTRVDYGLKVELKEKTEAVEAMKEKAGCFVLISNVPLEGPPHAKIPYDGKMLLHAYKDQNGIERNFSFLKDPVIVNAVFLKKPERVEALGLILVLSLLIWRLIELTMRQYLEKNQCRLPGWNNRPTDRPTTFMMTTKFESVLVLKIRGRRLLGRKLSETEELYLVALGLTRSVFTQPVCPSMAAHPPSG